MKKNMLTLKCDLVYDKTKNEFMLDCDLEICNLISNKVRTKINKKFEKVSKMLAKEIANIPND